MLALGFVVCFCYCTAQTNTLNSQLLCVFMCGYVCVCVSVCVCDMKECSISFSMHTHTRARALALQRRSLVLRPQRKRGWVQLGEQQMHKNKSWWALYARTKKHTHTHYIAHSYFHKNTNKHIYTRTRWHASVQQRFQLCSNNISAQTHRTHAHAKMGIASNITHTHTQQKKQQLVGGCLAPKTHAHKHTH